MLTPLGSLTTVTSLPAYELAEYCYYRMFTFCVSLTNLPELPEFSSLATGCFYHMFHDCTALEKAPRLWAEFLEDYCCEGMFLNCTKLSSVTLFIDSPQIDENFNPNSYLWDWLNGAGTDGDSPQLYLGGAIGSYYNIFREYLTNDNCFPGNWTVRTD